MSMPVLFVGHGTPMNAIENNEFTNEWKKLGKLIQPKAILVVSAHWYTRGLYTQDANEPAIVNDMYGFPKELYEVGYGVKGSKELSDSILKHVKFPIAINNDWGIDHGAWSVLVHMYPDKKIPVVELSVDAGMSVEDYYKVGRQLKHLRDQGVLIIGSGNIVHNLRMVDFYSADGYDWAKSFDKDVKDTILNNSLSGQMDKLFDYKSSIEGANYAAPTPEHFDPIFHVLGAVDKEDKITVFNDACTMGSLSMTSYLFSNS